MVNTWDLVDGLMILISGVFTETAEVTSGEAGILSESQDLLSILLLNFTILQADKTFHILLYP